MLLNKFYHANCHSNKLLARLHLWSGTRFQTAKPIEANSMTINNKNDSEETGALPNNLSTSREICPAPRIMPMVLSNKEPIVLSFDDVPGPKSLKHLSNFRHYLTEIGTQITAGAIRFGLNIASYLKYRKSVKNFTTLFDEYGPVVRFVSPVGGDIVLINHPDHIQRVYSMEGEIPIRSTLDSLEKYRLENRNHCYGGLYTAQGQQWMRKRSMVYAPLNDSVETHLKTLNDICDKFTLKIYDLRNYQDEIPKDLYGELHKWAFDCLGLIIFAKRFTMLSTEVVSSQCDMSWMYRSVECATNAILKCESGLRLWKLFSTPAWYSLVKYCDSLDHLIGKYILEIDQELSCKASSKEDLARNQRSLIGSMLTGDHKINTEDIATIVMDMLLIGVNTITSSAAFLLYFIAKHQKVQKLLYQEIQNMYPNGTIDDIASVRENTPYLQACIKETLRLVPPIPLLTRILPKNITLDRYNIPRGTMIIMSTQDASLKESNYDEATKFNPERWLTVDAKDYHAFASIPFGYGARKCLGQNIAENMLSLLAIRVLQKYKLEYHYGDIEPTRTFITRPNKTLKIRFIDRF